MMKLYSLVFFLFLALSTSAQAQQGEVVVISATPNYVVIQERQCKDVYVEVPGSNGQANTGSVLLGSVIGNIAGAAIGGAGDRTLGTVLGGAIGAATSQEQARPPEVVKRIYCETVPRTVQRGETVLFSYKGTYFKHTFE